MSSRHGAASATSTTTALTTARHTSSQLQARAHITQYPLQLWWFVASLIALVIITHVSSLWVATLRRRRALTTSRTLVTGTSKEADEANVSGRRVSPLHRRLANVINACRIILYRRTIALSPWGTSNGFNVTEILFGVVYLAATLIWCFINSPSGAKDFANRAGFLAASQTPLVVGLAGKNNVISFLTGVPPEKLQVLHRSSALALLVLSLIHAFSEVALGLSGHNAIYQPRIIYGVVALVAFVLATLLASRYVRERFYEFFLISHIVLILIFLVGVAVHMPQSGIYIYPAIALWGLDRVARVFRLIFFSRAWRSLVSNRPNVYTRALIEPLSEDTLRVIVPRRMQWKAGQYAYIILPGTSVVPFEAHPFTIASAALQKGENDLVFIIRARDGCTKRLLKRAAEGKNGTAEITALIDGPYGCPPSLSQYSTVVLIAGGSGVSYTLAQLTALVHHARSSAVQRVRFVWVIRHASHIRWITSAVAELLPNVPPEFDVQIGIWVTQRGAVALPTLPAVPSMSARTDLTNEKTPASHRGSVLSISPSVGTKSVSSSAPTVDTTATDDIELLRFSQVHMHPGRPDIESLLKHEIHGSSGPVSVDVCGPAGLAQEVRSTLTKWDVVGVGKEVELHVETFGW